MTSAESTLNAIKKLLQTDYPDKINMIGWALRRHRQDFDMIKNNIEDTSLTKSDADERMRKLCSEYGIIQMMKAFQNNFKTQTWIGLTF